MSLTFSLGQTFTRFLAFLVRNSLCPRLINQDVSCTNVSDSEKENTPTKTYSCTGSVLAHFEDDGDHYSPQVLAPGSRGQLGGGGIVGKVRCRRSDVLNCQRSETGGWFNQKSDQTEIHP